MITVIGSGYIGSYIADYLAANDDTVAIDVSEHALSNCRIARTLRGDVRSCSDIIKKADLVIVALPGNSAGESVKKIASMGKDIVDISFMAEDPAEIGEIAARNGAFYVPHCGFAPGLTNIMAGSLSSMGYNEKIEIYCGGLPLKPENSLGYKVTWSVEGLIDEYTRTARYIENGNVVEIDPLSSIEPIRIDGYGEFEAFYSDGLSTLLKSEKIKNISEKTLRFPGHIEKIRFMREIGMFSDVSLDGLKARDYAARLLENLPGSSEDQCIMLVRGVNENGQTREFVGYDRYDQGEQRTAMCRMTGLTCASVALSLLDDPDPRTGMIEPESLGWDRERKDTIFSRISAAGVSLIERSPQ